MENEEGCRVLQKNIQCVNMGVLAFQEEWRKKKEL